MSMSASDAARFEAPSRFTVEKVVGEGSFGIVSKCWDTLLQRDVALKFPKEGHFRKDLFLREARAASRLQHENIVRIFDVGEHKGHVYIVSEFIDGKTLRAWLDRKDHSMDDVLRIMILIARSIDYAHKNGVIHRDLKPGNILVANDGQPRVLDFGLSRSIHGGEDSLMKPGQQVGTPAFMAPEQVRGEVEKIDARTDVYALGVILFQLLVRQLPYSGSVQEVYEAIVELNDAPTLRSRNRSIPAPLEAICSRAMAKQQDNRYQTASGMADDIQNYLEGHTLDAYRGLHRRRVNSIFRRNWLAAAAIISTVAAIGGGWWIVSEYQARNPMVEVVIDSDPPGASLTWTRFDPGLGMPDWAGSVKSMAGNPLKLKPGFYHIAVSFQNERMEVYRTVPISPDDANVVSHYFGGQTIGIPHLTSIREGNRIRLPEIKLVLLSIISSGMSFVAGGEYSVPSSNSIMILVSGRSETLQDFLIDTHEVTWGQVETTWPGIVIADGQSSADAVDEIPWDVALAWAEANGKRLPSIWELQFVATNGGKTQFPNGDSQPAAALAISDYGTVADWDRNGSSPPVTGLLTGRNEWTINPFVSLKQQDGELVPAPAVKSADSNAPSSKRFPNEWYVFRSSDPADSPSGIPFKNLMSCSEPKAISNLGFRTVRQLGSSISQ